MSMRYEEAAQRQKTIVRTDDGNHRAQRIGQVVHRIQNDGDGMTQESHRRFKPHQCEV